MAFGNFIKEETTTAGTGTVTVTAVTGFPRFSDVFSATELAHYGIRNGNNWEVGIGTVGAGNTLARTTVQATYESGTYDDTSPTALTLDGTSTVFITFPSDNIVDRTAANTLTENLTIEADVDITGVYNFPTTSSATAGVINQNSAKFIHTFGTDSIFIGANTGNFTFTGSGRNVVVGINSLRNIETSRDTVVIGYDAGQGLTTANGNVLIGMNAGRLLQNGGSNVVIGKAALSTAVSSITCFAIGFQALQNNTANGVMGLGYRAMESNTTAIDCVGIGPQAGFSNTGSSGDRLHAFGRDAAYFNPSATDVLAVGYRAGYGVSGNANTGGTFVGNYCYTGITTGDNGIGLGFRAGDNITTGSNDIIIGYDVDAPSATAGNQLVIGNLIFGNGIDGTGTTISSGSIGIGIASPLSRLHNNGSFGSLVTTVTLTSHTAANETVILVDDDTAGSAVTIPLPAATEVTDRIYFIKKLGTTANVIVDGNASETIDGATTATLTSQYESITISCDGSSWHIL